MYLGEIRKDFCIDLAVVDTIIISIKKDNYCVLYFCLWFQLLRREREEI
jgi:hypothetical protein